MKRRRFLQTVALGLTAGRPSWSGAIRAPATAPDRALGLAGPAGPAEIRRLFFGLGTRGVSGCRGFFDRAGPTLQQCSWAGIQDGDVTPEALQWVDEATLSVLVLSATDPHAMNVALGMARAIQARGALLTLAVLLHPPGSPWQRLARKARVNALRAATQALVLQPDGEAPGMPSTETTEPLFQTLSLFALAPSLIDCDVQDLCQAMGSGGLWVARSAPFAGIERGADPGAAIDRCIADLGGERPNALVARWQAGLGDLTLASYGAIVAACERRLAPEGVALVTTGLVWEAEGEKAQLLLLARVD